MTLELGYREQQRKFRRAVFVEDQLYLYWHLHMKPRQQARSQFAQRIP